MTINDNLFISRSDVAKLAPAIIDVITVANKHGVKCWLNYGALLGIIREKGCFHGITMLSYAVGMKQIYLISLY